MADLRKPKERNLFLAQQVTQESINKISQSIIEINEDDQELEKIYALHDIDYVAKPIKLYIDSYGGYVYQCFGLLGIMRASKVPVHTIVTGCAMSCGFLISITGHKRFGYPKSTYLYHQVSSGVVGTVKEMEDDVIEAKRLQKMIETHTLELTNISKKKLEKVYKTKKDWFIDSDEAIKLKIIDEIL
jgi:ATP-dependent Clp protease protease subunit